MLTGKIQSRLSVKMLERKTRQGWRFRGGGGGGHFQRGRPPRDQGPEGGEGASEAEIWAKSLPSSRKRESGSKKDTGGWVGSSGPAPDGPWSS